MKNKIIFSLLTLIFLSIFFIVLVSGDFALKDRFDVAGDGVVTPRGLTGNTTDIWVLNDGDEVHHFLIDGTFIDTFVLSSAIQGEGITNNGTDLWVVEGSNVDRYYINGTFIDTFSTSGEGATITHSITTNGSDLWIGESNDDEVYHYLIDGTFVDQFDTSGETLGQLDGMGTSNGELWITDYNDDLVYHYYTNGTFIDKKDILASGNGLGIGLTTNGTDLWVVDFTEEDVFHYLFINNSVNYEFSAFNSLEWDTTNGQWNSIAKIDNSHFIVSYTGTDLDGYAVVLEVADDGTITNYSAFEYDDIVGGIPTLNEIVKVNDSHYIVVYQGISFDLWYVVLEVNLGDWSITNASANLQGNQASGQDHSIVQINKSHYINAYSGSLNDGFFNTIQLDLSTFELSLPLGQFNHFEFDIVNGEFNSLVKINKSHYLNVYKGVENKGYALIVEVNFTDWNVTNVSNKYQFSHDNITWTDINKINDEHYLVTYTDESSLDGFAVILEVDKSDWSITNYSAFEFDDSEGEFMSIEQMNLNHYLVTYDGAGVGGYVVVLEVNTTDWTIKNSSVNVEYETSIGAYNALAKINDTHYINVYTSAGSDGFARVITAIESSESSDLTNPLISILSPTNDTTTSDTGLDVNYTASDEIALDSCWWTEDTGTTNTTLADCITNITSETWTEGENIIVVYTNDTSNNLNSSSITFTLDSTAPLIIDSGNPSSGSTTPSSTLNLSFNITESNLGNATINWNGTNYTAYNSNNSLRGMCNMDNRSSLGENNTLMHCWNEDIGYNITPTNDAVPVVTGGRYSGGYYLDGSGDSLNMGSLATRYSLGNLSSNNSFTVGMWIKRDRAWDDGNDGIFDFNYAWDYRGFKYTYEPGYMACFSRYGGCPSYSVNLARDTWYHIVVVKNDSNMSSYLNGVYKSSSGATNISNMSFGTGNLLLGKTDGSNYFNGTMDDFFFYNKTLTTEEIQGLYNAQITKHSDGEWGVNSIQSITTGKVLNSTQTTDDPFTYLSCATDSSNNENCTSQRTISRTVSLSNVIANFTSSLGNINSFFYGTNDQYNTFGETSGTNLDANCNGTSDVLSNSTWHRELLTEAGMNHIRIWNYDIGRISTAEGVYDSDHIQNLMDDAEYISSIGGAITFVGYGTPTWLANTTTGWCNQTVTAYAGNWASCPPTNATKLAIVHDYIIGNLTQVISEDKINFIPYNEPWHNGFFLSNLTQDNVTQAIESGKIYNASYDLVKANHPNVGVGWSVFSTLQTPIMSNYMMANFSDKQDFTGMHPYDGTSYFKNPGWNLDDTINDLLADCSTYSMSCSQIIFDEWDITIKHTLPSANYSMEVAYFYQYLLNNIPSQAQSMKFKFSARQPYSCDTPETEFPKRYAMVNSVNKTLDDDYNITKNFGTYHSSGSEMYNSSSTNSNILTVSSNKSGQYAITIMNTDTESKNISLNLSGNYPYNNITNMETGELFTLSDGFIELGVLDSYVILYLSSSVPPTITSTSPSNNTVSNNAQVNFIANLTDDVGLNNATFNIYNSTGSLINQTIIQYIAGEISVIFSKVLTLADDVYTWFISLWDDEFQNTILANQTLTVDFQATEGKYGDVNWTTTSNAIENSSLSGVLIFNNTDSVSQNISLYNLTNALLYNPDTFEVYLNNTISENTGNFTNISINAGNKLYVLNHYNVTESSSRSADPINIANDDNSIKYIASTLAESITVGSYIDVSGCNVYQVYNHPKDSVRVMIDNFSCDSNVLDIQSLVLNSGEYNIIDIAYSSEITVPITSGGVSSSSGYYISANASSDVNDTDELNLTNGTEVLDDAKTDVTESDAKKYYIIFAIIIVVILIIILLITL